MKNYKKIMLLLFCAVMLTGCGHEIRSVEADGPSLIRVDKSMILSDQYCYLIDENTGVVYLEYHGTEKAAITVMLNADGTPVTAQQLEIDY